MSLNRSRSIPFPFGNSKSILPTELLIFTYFPSCFIETSIFPPLVEVSRLHERSRRCMLPPEVWVISSPSTLLPSTLPPLVVALISPLRSFRSNDPPEVLSLSLPSHLLAWMLPPLVVSSISSFEFSTLILPPLVLPSTLPLTLSTSRPPPLVEKFWLPDTLVKLILPPLVDKSVEIFFETNTLNEIFSAFFQSVILSFAFAMAVSLLLSVEIFNSYISFNRC